MKPNLTPLYEDALVKRWRNPRGLIVSQGKRVSATCPLLPHECHVYAHEGLVSCMKLLKERLGTLTAAWQLMQKARGYAFGKPNPYMNGDR